MSFRNYFFKKIRESLPDIFESVVNFFDFLTFLFYLFTFASFVAVCIALLFQQITVFWLLIPLAIFAIGTFFRFIRFTINTRLEYIRYIKRDGYYGHRTTEE